MRHVVTLLAVWLAGHWAATEALRAAPPQELRSAVKPDVTACSESAPDAEPQETPIKVIDPLNRPVITSSRVEGRSGHSMYVSQKCGSVVTISFVLSGKLVELTANCTDGSVLVDGHDNLLDARDRDELQQLDEKLSKSPTPAEESCSAQQLLHRSVTYLRRAPAGLKLKRQSHPKHAISCLRSGQTADAEWTDDMGYHFETIVVGSQENIRYGCMGRCGAGCLAPSLLAGVIPQHWTKDCLNHDMCSWMNNSTFGAWDKWCGDEYLSASDDYLFPSWCVGK